MTTYCITLCPYIYSTEFCFVEPKKVILLLISAQELQELVSNFTTIWEPIDASIVLTNLNDIISTAGAMCILEASMHCMVVVVCMSFSCLSLGPVCDFMFMCS